MPLGMVLYGPMADFVKIEYILIATGLLTIIVASMMFFIKSFKIPKENLKEKEI